MHWIKVEDITLVITQIQKPKYLTLQDLKDSLTQELSHQVLAHTIQLTTCRMKENMFYLKISQREKENSWWEEDNLLQNFNLDDHKVSIFFNTAPGPGSYRLPSDFGQYDEFLPNQSMINSNKTDLIRTGRTSATSHNKR